MTSEVGYVGLGLLIMIIVVVSYGVIRYILGDEKYRKEHRDDIVRAIIEGTIFAILAYMVYLYG